MLSHRLKPLRAIALPACITVFVANAVHFKVLGYPFIQDDWYYLDKVLASDPIRLIATEFWPVGQEVYRPLAVLYFLFIVKVLGANPILPHFIGLGLHSGTAVMVGFVLRRLTQDGMVAWCTAVLYAGASFVHMDSLLWASGISETASTLSAILSIWLFLRDRPVAAAAVLGVGLLFKESIAFVPGVFLLIRWLCPGALAGRRKLSPIRRWLPVILVVALFAIVKSVGASVLTLPRSHPYALEWHGPHILANLRTYSTWWSQAIMPLAESPSRPVIAVEAMVAVALGARLLVDRERRRVALLLFGWAVIATAVYLLLPNHVYRYYLSAGLPALTALPVLGIRSVLSAGPRRLAGSVVIAALAVAGVSSSYAYFRGADTRGLDQPYVAGTNDLVRRGRTVQIVRAGLAATHPTLPARSILLFKGTVIWAFGQHAGPHVWYGDQSLRAYGADALVSTPDGLALVNPVEDMVQTYTGSRDHRIDLNCCPVFFFELVEGRLVERSLEFARRAIDVNDRGLMDPASAAGSYSLQRSATGAQVLRGRDNVEIQRASTSFEGHLDSIRATDDALLAEGWAGDSRNGPAVRILVFVDGRNVLELPLGAERDDLAVAFRNPRLAAAGFRYRIPLASIGAASTSAVRFFALAPDGGAAELTYPRDYPYRER